MKAGKPIIFSTSSVVFPFSKGIDFGLAIDNMADVCGSIPEEQAHKSNNKRYTVFLMRFILLFSDRMSSLSHRVDQLILHVEGSHNNPTNNKCDQQNRNRVQNGRLLFNGTNTVDQPFVSHLVQCGSKVIQF